ncbi:hypothetical protein KUCAC02_002295 [Chaenocephalus aceratus]|uniref:Uncharacterized protein n=1 Tax=Chaenocephalus aceratus TaxID=36190 RepID=A0ACB9XTW6_CHAAC|nr:hypothetical protein KUCAC02_002295 [Chaenocephalus aceratus]
MGIGITEAGNCNPSISKSDRGKFKHQIHGVQVFRQEPSRSHSPGPLPILLRKQSQISPQISRGALVMVIHDLKPRLHPIVRIPSQEIHCYPLSADRVSGNP